MTRDIGKAFQVNQFEFFVRDLLSYEQSRQDYLSFVKSNPSFIEDLEKLRRGEPFTLGYMWTGSKSTGSSIG